MLARSFIHLPGIGPKLERAIWRTGITNWQDFLQRGQDLLPAGLWQKGAPLVAQSLAALAGEQPAAELAALFPFSEHWRLVDHFQRRVYLDLESGGDPNQWGGITVIGLFDDHEVRQYIVDNNIWYFEHDIKDYDVVITFGGANFDLPLLKQVFGRLRLPPVQIDLCPLLRRLGLRGGLKRIEATLGLERPPEVAGLDGWAAVRLWHQHLAGRPDALPLLCQYNQWDLYNLVPLWERAFSQLRCRTLRLPGSQG